MPHKIFSASGLWFRLRPIGLALRAASHSLYTCSAGLLYGHWPVPPRRY